MRMVRVLYVANDDTNDLDGMRMLTQNRLWYDCLPNIVLNTTVLFWGMIEANLSLLAACLPSLRALLKTRAMDNLSKSLTSRTWFRFTAKSKQSTPDQMGSPITESPHDDGKQN